MYHNFWSIHCISLPNLSETIETMEMGKLQCPTTRRAFGPLLKQNVPVRIRAMGLCAKEAERSRDDQLYLLVEENYATVRHECCVHRRNSGLTDDGEGAFVWCQRCRARTRSWDNWSAEAVAGLTTGSAMGSGVATFIIRHYWTVRKGRMCRSLTRIHTYCSSCRWASFRRRCCHFRPRKFLKSISMSIWEAEAKI